MWSHFQEFTVFSAEKFSSCRWTETYKKLIKTHDLSPFSIPLNGGYFQNLSFPGSCLMFHPAQRWRFPKTHYFQKWTNRSSDLGSASNLHEKLEMFIFWRPRKSQIPGDLRIVKHMNFKSEKTNFPCLEAFKTW